MSVCLSVMVVEDHDGGDDTGGHHEHDAVEIGAWNTAEIRSDSLWNENQSGSKFETKATLILFGILNESFAKVNIKLALSWLSWINRMKISMFLLYVCLGSLASTLMNYCSLKKYFILSLHLNFKCQKEF